jgi:hypothetical protein
MKMNFLKLCAILVGISGLHAIKILRAPSISGVVIPENKVKNIWAVQGRDSTEVSNEDGSFNIKVKPGIWKIIIYSKESYQKNTVLDQIEATEGKNINLGEINLH